MKNIKISEERLIIASKRFRDKRTGEIVTQIPLLQMRYFEEVD